MDADELILVSPLAGWAMPLSTVPDPVFAGGMMGDGIAIDPTGDTLHAPCAATVTSIHAAGHAVALRTVGGAELLLHVGIDSVAMGGAGFERLVEPGASVVASQPLIRFDLDSLVRRARAAATPILLVSESGFAVRPIAAGLVAVGDPLMGVSSIATVATTAAPASETTLLRTITVALPHGLHARPAARIAAAVRDHRAEVALVCGGRRASSLSMTGLLGLGAVHGAPVTLEGRGADATAVIDAIAAILTAESEPDAAPAPPRPVRTAVAIDPDALPGVAAAPGLAIGPLWRLRPSAPTIPGHVGDAASEHAALWHGLASLRAALDGSSGVMAAHRAMLDDPDLVADLTRAVDDGASAAGAAIHVTRAQADRLAASPDRRLAERSGDLIDIGQRLAHAILGTTPDAIALPPGSILVADDLLPSQLVAIDGAALAGIALTQGGPTSHVAIMAAGIGVPMVVALGAALDAVVDGTVAILDGDAATLLTDPDAARLVAAQARLARVATAEAAARASAAEGRAAATRDGRAIGVHVNLGTAADAAAGVAAGAEGCGLLRTELLFLDRATPPSRAEQAETYRDIVHALGGRPLTIRLLDVGGDKPAPYLRIALEENPALGLRGIRVALAQPDVLRTQIAAILDAADAGPCRIMVPMVASLSEMQAVRAVLDELRGDRDIALGAMVETPAAAIGADLIASACDFLSIGSNDLTQYALAMDRGNPAVAAGVDGLHPAVLRLIAATCTGAGPVPVGVCGGLAADPLAVPILVGLGVTSLSVPPGRVAATRAVVSGLSSEAAAAHARAALACTSPQAVRALARAFAVELPA